jgi:hypothetical protein
VSSGGAFFHAPWSTTLKVVTAFSVAILAGVALLFATVFPRDLPGGVVVTLTTFFVSATLLGSALFVVRGYEVEPGSLRIRRLLWSTEIPLADLRAARADPTAMSKSLRLFGNGGLFVFAGLFWNRQLGKYRAFATLPRNAVVLQFERRAVVVTPDDPSRFLAALARACPQATVRRSAP